ncbi:hypothetical protein SAMN05421810_103536 [Amycolatopsis arida]|uniref:Uncharacterized protein n=1 Tax=Amycolatopsis arida TaxID=587909 RepID=A0A1I5TI03_9PSEU|nr:hypothetical protein [Amycolatopsis arida]TDX96086.1 hypothetical protein CLV69_103221 [Amycolatopsis arida]SFP82690.1 hypothetical protein SAMN05421810_103536 [Amycolatopsis arida]
MDDESQGHLAAIARTCQRGFRFVHLRRNGEVAAIHGQRWRAGAVDTYLVLGPDEAVGARYRAEDYGMAGRAPLWQTTGSVADVIAELLALPPHGAPGAPRLAVRPASALWIPGRVL